MLVLKFITTCLVRGSETSFIFLSPFWEFHWLTLFSFLFLAAWPRTSNFIQKLTRSTPKGVEDVSAYPYLFAELMGHGWAAEELTKLAGGNLLRVFSEVNLVRSFFRFRVEEKWDRCGLHSVWCSPHFPVPRYRLCEIVNHSYLRPELFMFHFYPLTSKLMRSEKEFQKVIVTGRTCERYEENEQWEAIRGHPQFPAATSNVGWAAL